MEIVGWELIESAPRDRDVLVLLHPEIAKRAGYAMEICHYESRPMFGETWTAQNRGFSTELGGATHWCDLPGGLGREAEDALLERIKNHVA